ncbi:MAG: VOC family protein [Planctomycetota bacterium]
MEQCISAVSLLVPDYDAGLEFYVERLGFELVEDTALSAEKRWVLVAPPGSTECRLLLAKAQGQQQVAAVGQQAGGRVFLFLTTNDFDADYARFTAAGVRFIDPPCTEPYGKVAVMIDPFGNRWDLIQPADPETDSGSA